MVLYVVEQGMARFDKQPQDTETTMRILIIDDTPANLKAAEQTLAGHQLTLVGSYDDAYKLLEEPSADYKEVEAELKRLGYNRRPDLSQEEKNAFQKEQARLEKELRPAGNFDVVLCDMMMPAGKRIQVSNDLVGQLMPVGFALVLDAVLHGAKYVGMLTDGDHHNHPAVAWIDRLSSYHGWSDDPYKCPARFIVNGATVGYFRGQNTFLVEGETCEKCKGTRIDDNSEFAGPPVCYACTADGKVRAKDWGKVLKRLLGEG